jgi:hypothetical protein
MKRIISSCLLVVAFGGFAIIAMDHWSDALVSVLRYGYWQLPSNMERRTVVIGDRHLSFLLARFALGEYNWSFANATAMPKTVHEWREQLGADIVVNGSYFSETYAPTGFYQTPTFASAIAWPDFSREEIPIGYTFAAWIDADDDLRLGYTPTMSAPAVNAAALTSFPTLVKDDISMIEKDSGVLARRTILAKTADETVYVIVTESGELSLYEVAQWLVAQPEDFILAGNLDGGPSTGLSTIAPPWNVEVRSAVVPNVIAGSLEKDW